VQIPYSLGRDRWPALQRSPVKYPRGLGLDEPVHARPPDPHLRGRPWGCGGTIGDARDQEGGTSDDRIKYSGVAPGGRMKQPWGTRWGTAWALGVRSISLSYWNC